MRLMLPLYLLKVLLMLIDRRDELVRIYCSNQVVKSKLLHLYLCLYGVRANVWQECSAWVNKQAWVNLRFLRG